MCVGDGHRTALRHGQQGEPVEPAGLDDRLEIADPGLEAEVVADVPIGETEPALVVPDDGRDRAEVVEEVSPHWAVPVVGQVAEPARCHDKRWSAAVPGVGNADTVGRSAEPDVLWRCRR